MDVSQPYRALCPALEGPVLEALVHTTGPLSGREVERLARRGSHRGLRLALARLVDQGLVAAEPRGGALLYTLNRDHVAAPVVEAMMELRGEVVRRLRAELETWAVRPAHASLFGSMARGDGDVTSDIDLLLVRAVRIDAENPRWRGQLAELSSAVERWTGNHASVMELSAGELRQKARRSPALFDDIRRDAIELAGPSLATLLRQRRRSLR